MTVVCGDEETFIAAEDPPFKKITFAEGAGSVKHRFQRGGALFAAVLLCKERRVALHLDEKIRDGTVGVVVDGVVHFLRT